MRRVSPDVRRRLPALAAAVALPAAAVAGLVALAGNGPESSGSTPPTAAAPPASVPASDPGVADTAAADTTTTTLATAAFADGREARTAAEGLLPAYLSSQFQVDVTDAACSEPATGAPGEQFVCYALKPGDLVIALRATVGEERLIDLTLITDQQPTTTTTVPVATTTGG